MTTLLSECLHEFRRHKTLADRAMTALDDADFFRRPAPHVNSVAIIVKHLAGNLRSRWTEFLTTDGEKPDRDRDNEFAVVDDDTRAALSAAWEQGWQTLFDSLNSLTAADLARTVTIRGEPHSVEQAILRALLHVAYHTGQILYLVRMFRPESSWLTIAPGQSREHRGSYLAQDSSPADPA